MSEQKKKAAARRPRKAAPGGEPAPAGRATAKKRRRHVLGRQQFTTADGERMVLEFTPAGMSVRRRGQRRSKAVILPHEQLCRLGCHRYEVYQLGGTDYHVRAEPGGVTVRGRPDGPVLRTVAPEALVHGQVLVQASLFGADD